MGIRWDLEKNEQFTSAIEHKIQIRLLNDNDNDSFKAVVPSQ